MLIEICEDQNSSVLEGLCVLNVSHYFVCTDIQHHMNQATPKLNHIYKSTKETIDGGFISNLEKLKCDASKFIACNPTITKNKKPKLAWIDPPSSVIVSSNSKTPSSNSSSNIEDFNFKTPPNEI